MHAVLALCFLMAYLTKGKPQYLGYGNILLGLTYFHLGHLLKVHEQIFQSKMKMIVAMSVTSYLIVGLLFPTSLSFVLNLLTRGNYFLNLLFSLSACLILYYLFRGISAMLEKNKMMELLSYYGRISLVVFAFHRPVLNWCYDPMLRHFIPDISYPQFLGCNLVLILISAVGFHFLAEKYVPKLIGKY